MATATYFHKRGAGHSLRGQQARRMGKQAWATLPSGLRKGVSAKVAAGLEISPEWHHSGKYATETYVYYPEAVEAFWNALEEAGYTAKDLKEHKEALANRRWSQAPRELINAAFNAVEIAHAKHEELDDAF